MKKIIAIFLNVFLVFTLFMAPKTAVKAEAEQQGAFALKYVLAAENNSTVLAETGDIITVSFIMQRTDSEEDYITNGFQNYIYYDLSFFEFVEGSIVCNDTGNATAQKLTSLEYGEVIQCQNMGKSYPANFVFCTFQLKVIGAVGTGTISNGEVYAFDTNFEEVTIEKQALEVVVSECAHPNKTNVTAQAATCTEQGWAAYGYCPDCELFFSADGKTLLERIPYIPAAHTVVGEIVHDENGHWYNCAVCTERVDYSVHSGGQATCQTKAKCEDCGQEYGEVDPHTHAGETYLKDKKEPLPWQSGYTGDIYCSDCNQLIEAGEIDNNWVTAGGILRLLVLLVVVLLFFGIIDSLLK